MGVTENGRTPRLHVVEVFVAVGIDERRAAGRSDEERITAHRAERARRRVDSARDHRLRPLEPRRSHRLCSISATSRAKYVTMMSAPARLIASRCSNATAVPSIQPSCAAAFTIAYSPLTW